MADKVYLDEEGVLRLKDYINDHFLMLRKAIDLLKATGETPGSIQNMIDAAVKNLYIDELEQKKVFGIYGGAAPEEDEL